MRKARSIHLFDALITGPCRALRPPSKQLCTTHARRRHTIVCSFPNFNKPLNFDTTMLWGDGVMICATELASDRIPLQEAGILSGIMLAIWAVVRDCSAYNKFIHSTGGHPQGGLLCNPS